MTAAVPAPSRRDLLRSGGALIVSFSLLRSLPALADDPPVKLPGDLAQSPFLDSWIRIDAKSGITVFTGKAELGQGVKTALLQIAAEELEVPPSAIKLVTADTGLTPNEGFTAGSQSMENSGGAIRNAAAQVRALLIGLAAVRFDADPASLKAEMGTIAAADGRRLTYADLVEGDVLHRQAQPKSNFKDPKDFTIIGREMRRIDIPAKVTGGVAYVQDLRLDGMVHARVVRPPRYDAALMDVDAGSVEALPGVIKVVRDGSFLAVVAEREFQAITAMNVLATAATWSGGRTLPVPAKIQETLRALPVQAKVIHDVVAAAPAAGATTISARYTRPYMMHASIGPSSAVGLMDGDMLTVWTHTQGVYPDRDAIAQLTGMDKGKVRLVHAEGSGCYGHNGADDAAADVALIARALPGRPVRLQWMREQEHQWEPYGPAMSAEVSAALDASGRIVDWRYGVWSNTHSMRPGSAGNLLAGQLVAKPFTPDAPMPIPQPAGGGDRNAIPLYVLPTATVTSNFIPEMPLRVSALRSLGAYLNVFAIESFMDELAHAAKADPVAFRLNHLAEPRAIDVVRLAAEKFGWSSAMPAPGRGKGFAFARYKNIAAYCAVAIEVEVNSASGDVRPLRVVAAVDSGMAVNPDGIRNQIEGAIIQSTSWTLYERVDFSPDAILSRDWGTYPILRFEDVPTVEVHVIDRPTEEMLGTGECGQGPASAAIANAVFNATGVRVRDLPLTASRLQLATGA